MRVIVKAPSDDTFLVLVNRLKSKNVPVLKENKKWRFMEAEVPMMSSGILYEILELNGTLERDVRNDLD